MVERQLSRRGIEDERVLAAMREVPRELFVPEDQRRRARCSSSWRPAPPWSARWRTAGAST